MKRNLLIISLLITTSFFTQNNEVIKITTSASGITSEIAIQEALRSALEQSYGSFISTKTNIKNDELIDDEIVSITNGDIHKYVIISENVLEGRTYITVESEISLNQINTFKKQIGEKTTKFDGALFGVKIKLQEINEKSETISLENLFISLKNIYSQSLDISINDYSEPKINSIGKYVIDFDIKLEYNRNIITFNNHLTNSLQSIAMNETENTSYSSLGKSSYPVILNGKSYYFRNNSSLYRITDFLNRMMKQNYFHYEISDGNETLFDPYELIRLKDELDKDPYMSSKRDKQSLLIKSGKYVNGGSYGPEMTWSRKDNDFYIPGIYIASKSKEHLLTTGAAKFYKINSIDNLYKYNCNKKNNYKCNPFTSLMHFSSEISEPFVYEESGIINSRNDWNDGNVIVNGREMYLDYNGNPRWKTFKYKFKDRHYEIKDFVSIWDINKKKEIGFRVVNLSMDPIIIDILNPTKKDYKSKESNLRQSYKFMIQNPKSVESTVLNNNEFYINNEINFEKIYNITNPLTIDYELVERTNNGGYDHYRGGQYRGTTNEYSYVLIKNDLSNLKLSKKKKQLVKNSMNDFFSSINTNNLKALKHYLKASFDREFMGYLSESLIPYNITSQFFRLKLVFSKEKLSQISEFKLEKSKHTWN